MQKHDSISMYISSISALVRKLNDLGESISEAIAYQDQGWITTQLWTFVTSLGWCAYCRADMVKSFHARLLKRESTLKNRSEDTNVENDKAFVARKSVGSGAHNQKKNLTLEQSKEREHNTLLNWKRKQHVTVVMKWVIGWKIVQIPRKVKKVKLARAKPMSSRQMHSWS